MPRNHGNRYVLLLARVTGANDPGAKIIALERGREGRVDEMGPRQGGRWCIMVAVRRTDQDRSTNTDRREGGCVRGTGRNYPPFIGMVLGHGRIYEEGGRTDGRRQVNFPRSLRGRVAIFYHNHPPAKTPKYYQSHGMDIANSQALGHW